MNNILLLQHRKIPLTNAMIALKILSRYLQSLALQVTALFRFNFHADLYNNSLDHVGESHFALFKIFTQENGNNQRKPCVC